MGVKEGTSCLYSQLPSTMETQRAKEAAELLSQVDAEAQVCDRVKVHADPNLMFSSPQVKYKEAVRKETSSSLYSTLPDTLETSFAREMTDMQSQVRQINTTALTKTAALIKHYRLIKRQNCFSEVLLIISDFYRRKCVIFYEKLKKST